jgi:hypothetical protein
MVGFLVGCADADADFGGAERETLADETTQKDGAAAEMDERNDGANAGISTCGSPLPDLCSVDGLSCDCAESYQAGDATCAFTQYGGELVAEICAIPDIAPCFQMEDDLGQGCQQCATSLGQLVYDDCSTSQNSAINLEPVECHVLEDSVGRCVDCMGASGSLILRQCETVEGSVPNAGSVSDPDSDGSGGGGGPAPPPLEPGASSGCETYSAGDSLTCTVCYDDAGGIASETCEANSGDATRCELLTFENEICETCVAQSTMACAADADCGPNQGCLDGLCATFISNTCSPAGSNEAADDGGFDGEPEPPADPTSDSCTLTWTAAGLCRTCPTLAGGSETQCLSGGALTCTLEIGTGPQASMDAFGECLVCRDGSGDLAYRRCQGNAGGFSMDPPLCQAQSGVNGSCETCRDPDFSVEVFSTCDSTLCAFESTQIDNTDGTALMVGLEAQPAIVDCNQCEGANGDAQSAQCLLVHSCGYDNTTGGSVDLSGSYDVCGDLATLRIAPADCGGNPWESADAALEPGSMEEMQALIFHTLRNIGVPLIHVLYHPSPGGEVCVGRTDFYEVRAPVAAVATLQNSGFSLVN